MDKCLIDQELISISRARQIVLSANQYKNEGSLAIEPMVWLARISLAPIEEVQILDVQ